MSRFPGRWFPLLCAAMVLAVAVPGAAAQAPSVDPNVIEKVTDGIYVIRDRRVNLVPNIGIIIGRKGVLVVDTGMGPKNADKVVDKVQELTDKPIRYLTMTHFHPEHGMGAQAFPAETTIIYPEAQKDELDEKGKTYIEMFRGFGPEVAQFLEGVRLVEPDVVFERKAAVDLGDCKVELLYFGAAHTRGDSLVYLPNDKILFAGDLVVNRFFPIMPDGDADGNHWIEILGRLAGLDIATVVPGHGEIGDATLIARMKEYLETVRSRVTQLHQEGMNLEQIQAVLAPEIRKRYQDWDNPNWIENAIQNFHAKLAAE